MLIFWSKKVIMTIFIHVRSVVVFFLFCAIDVAAAFHFFSAGNTDVLNCISLRCLLLFKAVLTTVSSFEQDTIRSASSSNNDSCYCTSMFSIVRSSDAIELLYLTGQISTLQQFNLLI